MGVELSPGGGGGDGLGTGRRMLWSSWTWWIGWVWSGWGGMPSENWLPISPRSVHVARLR